MDISIKQAGEEDISALYDLYAALGKEDDGYFETCFEKECLILIASAVIPLVCPQGHSHEWDLEKEEQQSCSLCGSPLLVPATQAVGMTGAVDVAFGVLNFEPKYNLYKKLGIPEIQDLNVLSEHREQGIGTKIIEAFEVIARDQGAEQIGISVGLTKDYGAAQRLYAKLGYIPDGYGVTYDREPVTAGASYPVDDDLALMMIKEL